MEFPRDIVPYINKAKDLGTPSFMYLPSIIESNINTLKNATEGFEPRYAVKTNPNPWLLRYFKDHLTSLDVSSAGEIDLALANGWQGSDIEFTGPAKTERDIHQALSANIGSLVIEDLSETELIAKVAQQLGKPARVLIRIAPAAAEEGFGIRLAGRATQFGVELTQLDEVIDFCNTSAHIQLVGFHIYSGSQCLDGQAMADHFSHMWAIFKDVIPKLQNPLEELVFGAGMGIPYHDGDPELDLTPLSVACKEIRQDLAQLSLTPQLYIEVGRYLVGTAGFFLTEVIRTKQSKGKWFAICDGGMNHNLAACGHLGGIGHRHYSMINAAHFDTESQPECETYRVVGPLCTAIDTLAQRVSLPKVEAGQILAVSCAGAYGPSSSPVFFISHNAPKEVVAFEKPNGEIHIDDCTWLPSHKA